MVEFFTIGSFFIAAADSLVSLSQRPEFAAAVDPACITPAAVPSFGPRRSSFSSTESSPCEVRNASTSVEEPKTAMPSPSLITSISAVMANSEVFKGSDVLPHHHECLLPVRRSGRSSGSHRLACPNRDPAEAVSQRTQWAR